MTSSKAARWASSARSKKKYPERARARNRVARAIKAGLLVRPSECERCGIECRVEASHDDYAQPLAVEWLCRPCHAKKDRPTHCKHGHEFTPENTYLRPGMRECRSCRRKRMREAKRPPRPLAPGEEFKGACSRGHEFTVENTYLTPDRTTRKCRICHREANRNWRKSRGGRA